MQIQFPMLCRYCKVSDEVTDIYLVARNRCVEGFCLSCYEKYLDDKRANFAAKG